MAGEAAAAAATTTETTTAASAAAAAPWYAGKATDDMIGTWRAKGWDDKDPMTVALEATKSYREAEKLIGVPSAKLIRVPDTAEDTAGWSKVWEGLGAPKDAAGYDFTGVKMADGNAAPQALVDSLRATASTYHLPKDAASALATTVAKYLDNSSAAQVAEKTAKIAEEKAALTQSWGGNFEANKFIAGQAATKLGIAPEAIAALEGQIGYSKVMEAMLSVGKAIGEGRYVAGGPGGNGAVTSREEAVSKINDLKNDKDFQKRYFNGDVVAKTEMAALHRVAYGTE